MPSIWIDPRDKPGLLIAAMRAFEGSGQISFEGGLRDTGLNELAGVTHAETEALRRVTSIPELDFVVAPLTSENIAAIWKALENRFVFGAYDNFDRDCVVATDKFPVEILDRLVERGVIRSYNVDAHAEPIMVGRNIIPT